MKAKLLNLLPIISNSDLNTHAKSSIADALNKLISDEELLKIAEYHYMNLFADDAPLLENICDLSVPEADVKLGRDMIFTLLPLARAWDLESRKIYTYGEYDVKFIPTLLQFLKQNIEQSGCAGVTSTNRLYMYMYSKPNIFVLGRLAYEIKTHDAPYVVWRSTTDGSTVPLIQCGTRFNTHGYPDENGSFEATQKESTAEITGYTYTSSGLLDFEPVTLSKAEYTPYIKHDDYILSVHIPGGDSFTPDVVDISFQYADEFFKKYFPQINFKAYTCSSWLLDTGLERFMKKESNILSFQSRYRIGLKVVNKISLFSNIFKVPNICPLDELVPANRFQREVLEMVKAGGNLYSGHGYIMKD